jgi:hypothetical protein
MIAINTAELYQPGKKFEHLDPIFDLIKEAIIEVHKKRNRLLKLEQVKQQYPEYNTGEEKHVHDPVIQLENGYVNLKAAVEITPHDEGYYEFLAFKLYLHEKPENISSDLNELFNSFKAEKIDFLHTLNLAITYLDNQKDLHVRRSVLKNYEGEVQKQGKLNIKLVKQWYEKKKQEEALPGILSFCDLTLNQQLLVEYCKLAYVNLSVKLDFTVIARIVRSQCKNHDYTKKIADSDLYKKARALPDIAKRTEDHIKDLSSVHKFFVDH